MTFDPSSVPDHFWEAFDAHRCGLFVGAGLSVAAKLPDWRTLLDELVTEGLRDKVFDDARAADYRKALDDPGKFLMLATELKEVLLGTFTNYIDGRFNERCPPPTDLHRTLIDIPKARFILTTNYDTLIEQAYTEVRKRPRTVTYRDANQIQRSLYKREFFYLKAHGDASRAADEIILTEHDYRRILYKEPGYRSALEAIFTMYSVIFLGSSLRDPEINLMLQYVNAAFGGPSRGGPAHYAVVTREKTLDVERERWRKDFNMHFIDVSNADDYRELGEFLKLLSAR